MGREGSISRIKIKLAEESQHQASDQKEEFANASPQSQNMHKILTKSNRMWKHEESEKVIICNS